jgi:hypothetical protein
VYIIMQKSTFETMVEACSPLVLPEVQKKKRRLELTGIGACVAQYLRTYDNHDDMPSLMDWL